jgi:hypothetical protein
MALLQFASLTFLALIDLNDGLTIAIMFAIASLTIAFGNVVTDAIMIIQARRDPVNGTKNLVSLVWMFIGIGQVISNLLGGYTT